MSEEVIRQMQVQLMIGRVYTIAIDSSVHVVYGVHKTEWST